MKTEIGIKKDEIDLLYDSLKKIRKDIKATYK